MKSGIRLLGISVISLLFLAGCKEEKEGTFKVTFRGTYDNDPLVMFETHDYANGQRIQISRSEFFVSDLSLIDGSGNAYPLTDVEIVDLSLNNESAAIQGISFTFDKIPAGEYSDFEFGFGVASDINATQPSAYPSSSPLSNTSRYWAPWSSYIFSKTEGNLDTLVDGTDDADLGFAYHSGTDDLFKLFRINNAVDINDATTTELVFYLDHAKLLGLPSSPLNIKANPQNHNPDEFTEVEAIVNNVISALTFEIN